MYNFKVKSGMYKPKIIYLTSTIVTAKHT